MNVEEKIRICKNLTPVEADIGKYILNNQEKIENLEIKDLASQIPASKSAILRFCKKLGFKGYKDLKIQLAKDSIKKNDLAKIDVNIPFTAENSAKEISEKLLALYKISVSQTLDYINYEDLKKIVDLMEKAKIIDVFANQPNLETAKNFQYKMSTIGRIVNVPESEYQKELSSLSIDGDHLVFFLSYSGKADFLEKFAKDLSDKGVSTILISQLGRNFYPKYISYSLALSDKENMQDRISQFSSQISLQFLMDIIFSCFFNREREKNLSYLLKVKNNFDNRPLE